MHKFRVKSTIVSEYLKKKFCGVQGRFFKRAPGRVIFIFWSWHFFDVLFKVFVKIDDIGNGVILMKVNEATLQSILNAYGKEMRTAKPKQKESPQKQETTEKSDLKKELKSEELDIIKYDKDGKISIDSQKKEALIDFFQ